MMRYALVMMLMASLVNAGDTGSTDQLLGVRAALSNTGLSLLANQLRSQFGSLLGNLSVPTQAVSFKILGAPYTATISKVSCKDSASVGNIAASLASSANLSLAVTDVEASCSADWSYQLDAWPHLPKGSGTLRLKIGQNSSLALTAALTHQNPSTVSVSACSASLTITELHFDGGLSGDILNALKAQIEAKAQSLGSKAICSELEALSTKGNKLLAKGLGKLLELSISDNLLLLSGNVVGLQPSSRVGTPPALPALAGLAASDVLLGLDLYPLNALLGVAWGMGLTDWLVTDSVYAALPNSSGLWPSVAPGLAQQYPELQMQVGANLSSSPSFSALSGPSLTLAVPLDLTFTVISPTAGPVDAFAVRCPVQAQLTPSLTSLPSKALLLSGTLGALACSNLSLARSAVGPVDLAGLEKHLDAVLGQLQAEGTKVLSKGVELPVLSIPGGSLALANASLEVHHGAASPFLLLAADLSIEQQGSGFELSSVLSALQSSAIPPQPAGARTPELTAQPGTPVRVPPSWTAISAARRTLRAGATVHDIRSFGATAGAPSAGAANAAAIKKAVEAAMPGDTVLVPGGVEDFWTLGGIQVSNLTDVTVAIEGVLRLSHDLKAWPRDSKGDKYLDFFTASNCTGLTLTGGGMLDGQGKVWWNDAVIGKPAGGSTDRPRMLCISKSQDVLVEDLRLLNSPRFNLRLEDVLRAEVRRVTITTDKSTLRSTNSSARRLLFDPVQFEDLNTDGVDPSGKDIWVHDCHIQQDDDSIAVKPCDAQCTFSACTENVLIEDTVLIGVGASIGSVPPSSYHNCVRNVTFRNISMPQTAKGVYIKSNPSCTKGKTAEITAVTFEQVTILRPEWWAIWIGPQQQQEPGTALKEKCSLFWPFQGDCPTQGCVSFTNITLRDIEIIDPVFSPGVILGNSTGNINGLVFQDVHVQNPGSVPFYEGYHCEHAVGTTTNSSPAPGCLSDVSQK